MTIALTRLSGYVPRAYTCAMVASWRLNINLEKLPTRRTINHDTKQQDDISLQGSQRKDETIKEDGEIRSLSAALAVVKAIHASGTNASIENIIMHNDTDKNEEMRWNIHNVFGNTGQVVGRQETFTENLVFSYGLFFRGETRTTNNLRPRLFRENEAVYNERNLFLNFRQRRPHHFSDYKTAFELQCLMQHFGFVTRLLDWSSNVLVSLFFAVENGYTRNNNSDSCLYVLNAHKLNTMSRAFPEEPFYFGNPRTLETVLRSEMMLWDTYQESATSLSQQSNLDYLGTKDIQYWQHLLRNLTPESEASYYLARPIPVIPFHLDQRMSVQSSRFTLHGGKRYFDNQKLDTNEITTFRKPYHLGQLDKHGNKFLLKFTIPRECRDDIAEELRQINIHLGSLFPELDMQGKYLSETWKL